MFYCLKELRSFLGLCTYVPRFIESFSEKTVVLREVLKQDEKFKWQPKHQEAFERLKVDLASPNVLAFYDPSKELQLVTDASNHGIRGTLLQKEKGQWRPICYISRAVQQAQLKYSITEKEALSLVWAVEKLHLYLYGNEFTAIVDRKPLQFIFAPNAKLNARIARWQLKLQAYDFKVVYKKEKRTSPTSYLEIATTNQKNKLFCQFYMSILNT